MASQTKAKKPASKKGKKTPAKTVKKTQVKKSQKARNINEKQRIAAQHREVWVMITFFSAVFLALSVFNVKGVILEALASFLKGMFGVGAYIVPFSLMAICLTLLFSRGNPVAARIFCAASMPVIIGMLSHLLFKTADFSEHIIPSLYKSGQSWDSGGVIAGGIAAMLETGLSNVGALIIVFILLLTSILRVMNITLKNVLEFFIGVRDKYDERHPVQEYDEYEDEPVEFEPPHSIGLPEEEIRRQNTPSRIQRREKSKMKSSGRSEYDVPLEASMPQQETEEDPTDKITSNNKAPDAENEPPRGVPLPLNEMVTPSIDISADDEPEPEEPEHEEIEHEEIDHDVIENDRQDEIPFDIPQPVPEPAEFMKTPEPKNGPVLDPVVMDTHKSVGDHPTDDRMLDGVRSDEDYKTYDFPPIDILQEDHFVAADDATDELRTRSHKLSDTLSSFGVEAQIINVIRGPSVTRYELALDRGVKFSRLTSLQDDIALALGASGVRIAAIPDKSAVGIEVPNKIVQTVYLRDVLTSRKMANNKSKLAFALGKDITGSAIIGDIAKMPHMLIAGTTGSGKSVCINSIIVSLLYRVTPEEVRLIMIDPKMVELGSYNGIPHLLVPVVTDFRKAAGALNWAVVEMERRYKQLFDYGVRDLQSYNKEAVKRGEPTMPRIVIIIDELADLMMVAAKEIEESVCRIAQKARAAGMHLIIATQRPSADVLTGLMKSNIPSRIAFAVASQMESRIILDTGGAEKLIGRGDMLFYPLGFPKPLRVQGCYLSTNEVEAVTEYVKKSGETQYSSEIMEHIERKASEGKGDHGVNDEDEADELLDDAINIVMSTGQASASMLQRKLKLGYARAARIIDQMEARGIIGPSEGAKPRQLLISKSDWQEMQLRRTY